MIECCDFGKYKLSDGSLWVWDGAGWFCAMGPVIDQPCSSGPVCVGGVW